MIRTTLTACVCTLLAAFATSQATGDDPDATIRRLVDSGDAGALVELGEMLPVHEISRRLAAMPVQVRPLVGKTP